MSPTCTNSHYDNHATFVPSINHNKDVALLSYVELYPLHKMTEALQKGQKRYSLCFNTKHNFFWHFCAYIYVRKHVSSELFDYLIID